MNAHPSILQQVPIDYWVTLSLVLFSIGILGVLYRRNAIVVLMSIELMLSAVNLLLIAFSVFHNHAAGQVFVFFVMGVSAAEVAVGLAIVVNIFRNKSTVDIDALNILKG